MAQRAVVSEGGGGAMPFGAEYNILKAGSGTDVIASIRYHDEAMAKLFLHMFMQLGQTETGSRALGTVFVEYAFIAQKAVAQWFCDVVNEHVLEDWVDWNIGEDAPAPLLTYIVEEEDERIGVQDLTALIEAGAITVDNDLENALRERFKLPEVDLATVRKAINQTTNATAREAARLAVLDHYERTQRATGFRFPWAKK
jgi:hypothetical protein